MTRVSRLPSGIKDVSNLPRKYKHYEPFYIAQPGGLSESILIPENLRDNIFGIISTDGDNDRVYLLAYTEAEKDDASITETARVLLGDYARQEKKHPNNIVFAKIHHASMRDTIKKELLNKSKDVGKRPGTQNAEAAAHIAAAESILKKAMELKASDLHIESDGSRAIIRLRIHKELTDFMPMTHDEAVALSTIFFSSFVRGVEAEQEKGTGTGVYLSANLLDAEFSRNIGKNISMKARMVNIGQNYQGRYTLVLRLIDCSKALKPQSYASMGFSEYACKMFRLLQTASRGMILIVGVTGSGKSTSMQNMIQQERDRTGNGRKIYAIEQPIEQSMSRIIQINAENSHEGSANNKKAIDLDFSFDNLNRMLMRGDPDSIAYGEIRDNITAKAAIKGVESGHLVYGTMHVSSPMGVFSRFETFGITPDKLCRKSFIQMVLFQHLIPKLCPHCSKPYHIGGSIPEQFGEFYAIKSYRFEDGRGVDMSRVIDIKNELELGESLLRALQRKRLISAKDVAIMKQRINSMNMDNDTADFQKRLDALIESSTLSKDEINIRFRGDGCRHCYHGTVGVVPAAEILVPDENFLELILNGQVNKAEAYWKAKLGGKSATLDLYPKILAGLVDPRMVEAELDKLGS